MRFIKASLALCCVLSTVNCNGSSGGNSARLKSADPEASKKVTTSFAALQQFEEKKTGRHTGRTLLKALTSDPTQQKEVEKLSQALEDKLDTKDCTYTLPSEEAPSSPPSNGVNIEIHDIYFEIKGDKCPMSAYIKVVGNQDQKNIKARFEMGLTVRSADLQKEMNMKDGVFSGDLTGTVNQKSQTDAQILLNGTFSGNGMTLDYGPFTSATTMNLDFAMSGPQQGDPNGNLAIGLKMDVQDSNVYTFGNEKTVLASHSAMGPNGMVQEYWINGQPATVEKYNEYMSQIKIPGFSFDNGSDQNQPPVTASSCELLAFDAKQVSEAEIQKVMASPKSTSSLLAKASGNVTSCGMMQESRTVVAGQNTTLRLMFASNSNLGFVDVNGAQKNLVLQPEFEDYLTATISGVSVVYSCKPVPTCGN